MVFRDFKGSILYSATHHHACLDPTAAECIAIFEACKVLANKSISKAIIESDCLNVISFILGGSSSCCWSAQATIDDIKNLLKCWPAWSFRFVPRNSNGAAHALAKWVDCNFEGFVPLNQIHVTVFCDIDYPIVEPF
ncbi:hypothetical protein CASFOL_011248 [Castilleja foliolosa]|uniref:RNase H type-1 domain-containing protein n=1 Tax=Castilleja foliolosa TaxID=1961234 RepID=A0ABD3DVC3_9LAMI